MAIACDPVSAFGSVIACSRAVDQDFAQALGELFVECLIAPDFSDAAGRVLEARPNLRLLKMPGLEFPRGQELRTVAGGLLGQSLDHGDPPGVQGWQVVTQRQPSEQELADMQFAWQACQPVTAVCNFFISRPDLYESRTSAGDAAPHIAIGCDA